MVLDFIMHGLDMALKVLLLLRLVVALGTLQVLFFSVLLEEEPLRLSLDVHTLHVAPHATRGAGAVRTVRHRAAERE